MNKTLRNIVLGISLPILLSGCHKSTKSEKLPVEYLEGVVISESYHPATQGSTSKYSFIVQEENGRKVVEISDGGFNYYSKESVEAFISPNNKIKIVLPSNSKTENSAYFTADFFFENVTLTKDYKMEDLEKK